MVNVMTTTYPRAASRYAGLERAQARRLQVRALVPGEDLARLVPDVEHLAISRTNLSFFSFRHLPPKTTVELHFLRDSSAADLEILGGFGGG